ncbi:Gfo/Idh/MocA family protein [Streptosporangium sandarakinum]|uniref:Gfo/Idh/MocA family protein n=1 Tax=Streptosporangium sandarakinum TaxID=1260955 RepID=UPI0036A82681
MLAGEAVNGRPWRLAIAGCGAAAFGLHLPLLTQHTGFTVVAVADRDPRRAQAAAHRFGVPHTATSVEELLAGCDMLVVLTGVHDELIDAALDAGVHVFTEKPVSLSLERTRALRRKAEAAGLLLEVGAMRAYDPALHALLRHVPAPAGGWLIKTDGVDAAIRSRLLPVGFSPYTFDQDPPQPTPAGIDGPRLRALQILLWQGYHLLTALAVTAEQLRPVACALDGRGQSLHASVAAPGGQTFTLLIGPAPDGVFHEQIHLIGDQRAATLDFAQPYGSSALTRLTTHAAGDLTRPADGFGDPFTAMWTAIGRRLSGEPGDHLDSAALAEQIEDLAVRLAVLTQEAPALPTTTAIVDQAQLGR